MSAHYTAQQGQTLERVDGSAAIEQPQSVRVSKRLQNARCESEGHRNDLLEQFVAEQAGQLRRQASLLRKLTTALAQCEQHERQRIAGVLHDGVQQLLVAARLTAERMGPASSEQQRVQASEHLKEILGEAIEQSRSLAVQLCPPVLFQEGLAPAFQWLADQIRRDFGLIIKVEVQPGLPKPPSDVASVLFEAVRELLFNVFKHSKTAEATVSATVTKGDQIEVVVADQGVGFTVKHEAGLAKVQCFGLASLRRRIKLAQGRFTLQSAPGQGCTVRIVMPTCPYPDPSVPDAAGHGATTDKPSLRQESLP